MALTITIPGAVEATIGATAPAVLTIGVGTPGATGPGVPVGGTAGQFLTKTTTGVDYATNWSTLSLAGYATESWVTAGFYPLTGNPSGFLTASSLTPYLTKAGNLTGLTDLTAARDNLNLGTFNTPVFAGVTAQGSGSNIAQLTPTSLSLTHTTYGSFTIQPSQGIVFPDSTVQTTAFTGLSGYATESWVTSQGYLIVGDGGTVPAGGTTGQILAKASSADYSLAWESFIPGDRYLTTSTTSLAIDNANKTLTVGTGLSYTSQQDVIIAYDAARHMHARVTTYNSSTGVMEVDVISHTGTGTFAAWTVNVGGTVPLASVAWGDITGTIGSQSDLATELNAKLDHAGGTLDANASLTASDTSTATDSEFAGWGLGIQLSGDHTKGTTIEFDGLDTYDGSSHMQVTPTGLTFPDSTVQTTAGFIAGYGNLDMGSHSILNANGGTFDNLVTVESLTITAGVLTFPDSTVQTTAYTGGGGGGASWGSITGTLSSQTDLQTALDSKVGEAPQDNVVYGRVDGVWVPIPGTPTYTLIATGYTSIAGWLFSGTNIYLSSNGKVITDTPGSANGDGSNYFRINGSDTPGATLNISTFTGINTPIQLYSISSSNAPILPSSLAISGVEINGYAPADLPAAIFGYGGISYLNILNADITSVPSLSGISSLQGFYIDNCGSITSLPNFNSSVSGLTSFTAQYNASLTSIPELTSMSSLNYININGNPALTTIPQFANLPALANLYITNNTGLISPPTFGTSTMFGGELELSISGNTSMIGAPTLEYGKVVIIENNTAMTGTPVFYNFSMSVLQLNGNTSMTAGPDLSGINLTSASMSGNSSMVTPPSFLNCTSLTSLSVNYNVSMTAIPVTTGCSSLGNIDFSYNTAMTGTSDFTDMSSLSVLVMNDCSISVAPDFYGTYGIYNINLNNNAITSGLTGLLDQLDSFGTSNGYLGISGGTNEAIDPTYYSLLSLQSKGWTVIFNSL